ncbi:MAG: carbohydrate ABC transporter permease [Bacilli bacterium]|nr:carbohydrate ABC transporter permease [Bacilli bacterium]
MITTWHKIKHKLIGRTITEGILYKVFIYLLLTSIGYIFLFPLLFMLSNSLKDIDDLLSPMVIWIPSKIYLTNFQLAFQTLDYFRTFFVGLSVTLLPAVLQTFIASLIGYGFAKFKFPFKNVLLGLVLLTYIIPPQITMISKYVLFTDLGLTNSAWSIIIPASFGQGLNSALFIFIFYQFFRMLPKTLDDAARIDGANRYYIFFKIAIPLSVPAYVTSLLFAFVWYFNETYIAAIFLGGQVPTLQLNLVSFAQSYTALAAANQHFFSINEGVKNASTILAILPMLIMYFVLQKSFVEGIDKTGFAGGE